jgi:hypothetical protein
VLSVFKLEDHNLGEDGRFDGGLECHAVSVKNYVLIRRDADGNPIRDTRSKFSAHAMGNLMSPVDPETNDPSWIPEGWLWWLRREEGREAPEPGWLDPVPALHAMVVAHPDDFQMVRKLNRGLGYEEGIMPFDTLLLPHRDRLLAKEGDPTQLVAPWHPDPMAWAGLHYRDPATGKAWRLAMRGRTGSYRDWQRRPGTVFVESMRTYLERHFTHPEPAAVGPDGKPCGRETRGVLLPQPIRIERQAVVGKDTSRLREIRAGWRSRKEERQVFGASDDLAKRVLHILADAPDRWLRAQGVEPRTVRKARERGGAGLTRALAQRLCEAATAFSREALAGWTVLAPQGPESSRGRYLEEREVRGPYRGESSSCRGCGAPLRGHERVWCVACRKLPGRERNRLGRTPYGERRSSGRRRQPSAATATAAAPARTRGVKPTV